MAKKYTEEVAQVHTESGVQQAMHRRSLEDDCPLPAPEELQRFKDIDPRLVDFFMEQSRTEQQQRHKAENSGIDIIRNVSRQDFIVSLNGMYVMLAVFIVLAGIAVWLIITGYSVAGITFATLDAVGILSVFALVIKAFLRRRDLET